MKGWNQSSSQSNTLSCGLGQSATPVPKWAVPRQEYSEGWPARSNTYVEKAWLRIVTFFIPLFFVFFAVMSCYKDDAGCDLSKT